jgi:multidrug resistance efflux pump
MGDASAQGKKKPNSNTTLANRVAQARADLIAASKEYKASLEKLLLFEEEELKRTEEEFERRKQLFAEGLAGVRDREECKHRQAEAAAKVNQTRKQLVEADELILQAKLELADFLARTNKATAKGGLQQRRESRRKPSLKKRPANPKDVIRTI